MITLDIPGSGLAETEHLVTDFSGPRSEDGCLLDGVKEKLNELAGKVQVHVLRHVSVILIYPVAISKIVNTYAVYYTYKETVWFLM